MLSLIISIIFLSFSVVFLLLALGWRRRLSQLDSQLASFKQEPREAKRCVLCKHAGTTWSGVRIWDCCKEIAIVCNTCAQTEAGVLEDLVDRWHCSLSCPQTIAREEVLRIVQKEKEDLESMRRNPEAVHAANLSAAEAARAEEKWTFGVPDRNTKYFQMYVQRFWKRGTGRDRGSVDE